MKKERIKNTNDNENDLIGKAINGDSAALELIIIEINDFIFNLSLRMLGTIADAEDATQDILIKVITHLASFQQKSQFRTWVYRIASNYLMDYRKSMFSQYPLDFTYFENDLKYTDINNEGIQENKNKLANELKLSCTNTMLQCLKPQDRCIFVLGTMFKIKSKVASEILDLKPDNYRQRLSRSKKKMKVFLQNNCELSGGKCKCENRISYAIDKQRLIPSDLQYTNLKILDYKILEEYTEVMEDMEETADVFANLPFYNSTVDSKQFLKSLITSNKMKKIINF